MKGARRSLLNAGAASVALAMLMGVPLVSQSASAREWKTYESKQYGFAMKIPAEFKLQSEDKGATWIYQPGSEPSSSDSSKSTKKKRGFGIRVRGIGFSTEKTEESSSESSGSGGGLESALTIYVNWTWMPDVASSTLYSANKKSVQQDIDSPDPNYTDIIDFDKKKGYAYEGNTFWYKEVKKSDFDEIHRWHISAQGNKSSYIVGLCGTYRQFDDWGDVYEEVVKSFKLIPMEK